MDYAEKYEEDEFDKLAKKIKRLFGEAHDDIVETTNNYFLGYDEETTDKNGNPKTIHHAGFYERDEAMRKRLEAGEITEDYYKQWRLNNILRGERFETMRDNIAERMTNANETAMHYINDSIAHVYTESRNFAAYTIESTGANIDFALMNEDAVREALKDGATTMPYYDEDFPMAQKRLLRNKDIAYGQQQITASITQGIIQGRSISQIADDLQERITAMDRNSALRAARTASGAAYNAGYQAVYSAAAKRGIKGKKRWDAVIDSRTRDSHRYLDGVMIDVEEKFPNGLLFPRDPSGEPAEVYNCRCRQIYVLDEIADDFKSDNTVGTYSTWKLEKELGQYGYKIEGFDDYTGDYDTLKSIVSPLSRMGKAYPNIANGITILLEDIGDAAVLGQFYPSRNTISFNKALYNKGYNCVRNEYLNGVRTKLYAPGVKIDGVAYHEFGHAFVKNSGKITLAQEIKNAIYSITGEHYSTQRANVYLRKNLSYYSAKNTEVPFNEAVAESFAEWYNSEKPRPLSKAILESVGAI